MSENLQACALLKKPEGGFEFSIGESMYVNYPKFGQVHDFEEFIDVFELVRAPKKGTFYITPAFSNDGRRCNHNCKEHRYAGFDLDGSSEGSLEDDQYAEICLQMSAWRGFRYETASSSQGNRRARFILELDRPVSREDGMKVRKFIRELMPKVGNWDKSCDNPAQPLFMAPVDAFLIRFGERPLPVDEVLALIPPPLKVGIFRRSEVVRNESLLARLQVSGYWQAELNNQIHKIECPWADEHSNGRTEAFYFEPSERNRFVGGFHCFHSHCRQRNIGHLIQQLDCQEATNAA